MQRMGRLVPQAVETVPYERVLASLAAYWTHL
jgi:hypothetical protein